MSQSKPLDQMAKYQNWHHHLEENQIALNGIDPIYVHRAEKDGSVLYALLKVDGKSTGKEGENEHTHLHIATFPEAQQRVANLHGVLAHLLYLKQIGDYKLMSQL